MRIQPRDSSVVSFVHHYFAATVEFCDIEKAPTPKDERLLEHVAGRQYAVTFRDSEQRQN